MTESRKVSYYTVLAKELSPYSHCHGTNEFQYCFRLSVRMDHLCRKGINKAAHNVFWAALFKVLV